MFRELLFSEFRPYETLTDKQLEQLERHYQALHRWNSKLNLTRISDLSEIVRFHYCESLYLGLKLPPGALKVADVGSGAGFPGIPVSILRPDLEVTLIESHQRKAVFLRESSNLRVLAIRAEDCRESFDWITSRAVSPDSVRSLKLAPNFALLVTSRESANKLPWGRDRAIVFHVEHDKIL
jgi:16S rRNA (guanine527-N7)-methyltransferase